MARKPRKLRSEMNKIPSHVTKDYLEGLRCQDYMADPSHPIEGWDPLNVEESKLLGEFIKCGRDFEKWKKFREKKIQKAKGRK